MILLGEFTIFLVKIVYFRYYPRGGGALTQKGGVGMYHGHDPFFQASRHSLAYQFAISSQDAKFQNIRSQDPSLDPTFGSQHGTYHQKKVDPPLPRVITQLSDVSTEICV